VRLRHCEDGSGVPRGKDYLAIDIGDLHDPATGIRLLQVDVVHPKRIFPVHKVIGGDRSQPEGPLATTNQKEFMNGAVVDDLDGFSGLMLPSASWRILLVNNRHVMRASLPGGLVRL